MRNSRQNQKLTLNDTKKQRKNNPTNNQIFDNVFRATADLLQQDNEFSVEISDETAYPSMGELDEL